MENKSILDSGILITRECLFNEKTDLRPTDQFGFVNLREAYDKGVVPGTVTLVDDESFNGMLPADVMQRPLDIFERYRQRNYVKDALNKKAAEAKAEAVTEGGQ